VVVNPAGGGSVQLVGPVQFVDAGIHDAGAEMLSLRECATECELTNAELASRITTSELAVAELNRSNTELHSELAAERAARRQSDAANAEARLKSDAAIAALTEKVDGVGGVRPRLAAVEDAVSLHTRDDDANATECGAYPEVAGGRVSGVGVGGGAVRIIECVNGALLAGSSGVVVCHTDGEWSDSGSTGGGTACVAATSTTATATTVTTSTYSTATATTTASTSSTLSSTTSGLTFSSALTSVGVPSQLLGL